jgi:hypothetical protein
VPRLFVTATPDAAAAWEALRPRATQAFVRSQVLMLDVDDAEAERLAATPGLHCHRAGFDAYRRILEALDRQPEEGRYGAVANLSICHGTGHPDPMEPVNVATRRAARRGAVVVVAAGNGGPAEGSISRWATPWVVPVGAADQAGGAVLPLSGAGWAAEPESGPLVVARGDAVVSLDPFDPRGHGTAVALIVAGRDGPGRPGGAAHVETPMAGTSMAVPRVSRICVLLAGLPGVLGGLRGLAMARLAPGAALSDYLLALEAIGAAPAMEAPGLALLHGLPGAAVAPLLRRLAEAALGGATEVFAAGTPDRPEPVGTIRRMLCALARPVPDTPPHRAGAGFVGDALAEAWLADLTAGALLRALHGTVPPALALAAGGERVVTPALLDRLRAMRDGVMPRDRPVI